MSHQTPQKEHFVGKTIKAIDTRACNVMRLEFTDGTVVALETEPVGYGLYGIVECEACAQVDV